MNNFNKFKLNCIFKNYLFCQNIHIYVYSFAYNSVTTLLLCQFYFNYSYINTYFNITCEITHVQYFYPSFARASVCS